MRDASESREHHLKVEGPRILLYIAHWGSANARRGNFKKPAMWIGGAVSGSAQGIRRKDWAIDAVAQTEVYPLKISCDMP
jgi:hypothetical protein